ncbi:MAG: hypothetical protein EOP36_10330 [Rubrivivax sp.]|nr:MAG: hypothetical protein EOP36_10330 [Rubrivivax sp.]
MPDIAATEEASAKEIDRYEKAYRETRNTLNESIEALMILEEFETSSAMRDQLALKRQALEASRDDLVRANIAFYAGKSTMAPPSPALVADIVALSRKAVELTVAKATAAAALQLATSALNKFAQIQDI